MGPRRFSWEVRAAAVALVGMLAGAGALLNLGAMRLILSPREEVAGPWVVFAVVVGCLCWLWAAALILLVFPPRERG